jgi:transposase-like protein
MEINELKRAFMQGEAAESAALMQEILRGAVRAGLLAAMEAEVEELCGRKYYPDESSEYRRAGSETGSAYLNGTREAIKRPRVRHCEDGEVALAVYEAASDQRGIFEQVVASLGEGVSSRGASRLSKGGLSKSAASRMWVEKSREQLQILRTRPLESLDWLAVVIDGVWLSKELCVVVALGIDTQGSKHVLDFEQGSSESKAVVCALMERLAQRGVVEPEGRRLLVLRDGSRSIEAGVRQHWPQALQQECLVHVQRNVRDKLRQRDRAELDGLFKAWRESQGEPSGQEAFDELVDWVSERNAAAGIALKEKEDSLLAVHRLNLPSTLNITLLSTNLIENMLRNWREATGNVKLWKEKGDMVSRWSASGLLWAEAGFRKIRHYEDLPALTTALQLASCPDSLRSPGHEEKQLDQTDRKQ